MKNPNDLWEAIGLLAEDEVSPVLTRLFAMFEERLARNPDDAPAREFFRCLDTVIGQATLCNLNRR